jgi:thiol-disulfide isomerase/thioredoxin
MKPLHSLLIGIAVLGALVGVVLFLSRSNTAPGPLDATASCIASSGAQFYGAFWCPHCKEQKAAFGSSAHLLPYVECAVSLTEQVPACTEKGVKAYPTWIFSDGTRAEGTLTPKDLAERTHCPLLQ